MRVLVTGGAGFIGSTIVDDLVADGHDVVVVDALLERAHRQRPEYLNDAATYLWGDLADPTDAGDAVRGVDAVSHQSSLVGLGVDFADVVDYVQHNDAATAVLLRALHDRRFNGRIVLASSMVVYGEGRFSCAEHGLVRPEPRRVERLEAAKFEPTCPHCEQELRPEPVEETAPTDPRNVYAATKLHQEHLCGAYAREHNSSVISLRYHNVYGARMPRDTPYAGVAAIFRSAYERGEPPRVFEDGGQIRDFVNVRDVAQANLAALAADPGINGAYNVASGDPHTILEMANALGEAFGPESPPPVVTGSYRLGDVRHVFASPLRAQRDLGFRAATAFRDGVTKFASDELRA